MKNTARCGTTSAHIETLGHITLTHTPSWWVACPSWSCVRVSLPWSVPASWLPRQPPELCSLHPERGEGGRGGRRKQSTESASNEEELVNRWLLAGKRAQMIEGSEDEYMESSSVTEGDVNGERVGRGLRGTAQIRIHISSCWGGKPSLFSLPIHLEWDSFYILPAYVAENLPCFDEKKQHIKHWQY